MAYYVDKEFKATITDIKNIITYNNEKYAIIEITSNEDSSKYKIAIAMVDSSHNAIRVFIKSLHINSSLNIKIEVNSKDNGGSLIDIYHKSIGCYGTDDFVKQNENGEWEAYCDFSVKPYIFTLIEENKYNEAH